MNTLNPAPRQKDKILALVSSRLDRHHEILFAYCHGSFMGDGPFHDIDIAIFLEPGFVSEINFRYEMQLGAELEKAFDIPAAVDVRILNAAKLSFQFHALRGRLLLDRNPEARIDFTTQIASRYLDIAPILKHHTKEAFGFDPGPRPNPG